MQVLICTAALCIGFVTGLIIGIKLKNQFYEFMLDEWYKRCNEIQIHNHENLLMIIEAFKKFDSERRSDTE